MRQLSFFLLCTVISVSASLAQDAVKPRPSPISIVTMKFDHHYVKITYGQPHKKGREVFGGIVPYGKVWRTGANEATEITTNSDLEIDGQVLPKGTYTVFTIPDKDSWTVIFNKEVGQWGAYNYNEEFDALRVKAPVIPIKEAVFEPFTIKFRGKNESGDLIMMWDKTSVELPIKFVTEE